MAKGGYEGQPIERGEGNSGKRQACRQLRASWLKQGLPVRANCCELPGFIVPAERVADAITDRTRLIFLNSPNNPSGQVWSYDQLKALSDVVLAHENIYLVSDEIYGLIVYDGTLTTLPPLSRRRCACGRS